MDLVVYDTSFKPLGLIDDYEELIWTDRYYAAGDFEVCMYPTEKALTLLKKDYYLYLKESEHMMIIEGLELKTDTETGNRIIVTGRSLESILDRRVVWKQFDYTGSLQNGVKRLLEENVINPSVTERRISNFIFEESTDSRITALQLDTQYTGDNLYDIISVLCQENQIGFKVTLNDSNQFVFKLYCGNDRTYEQTTLPYVVFSPSYENMINSNYQTNREGWKNVTLIGGEGEGLDRRYSVVGTTSGLDRRELFTDARDISSDKDDFFNPESYTAYPLFINANSKILSSASNNRLLYYKIDPDGEYRVTRDYDIDWTLRIATCKTVPAVNVALTEVVADDGNQTSNATIVAGPEDNYLVIQLFIDADVTNGATVANSITDLKIQGPMLTVDYIALLDQRGSEKLTECKEVEEFESEVDMEIMYRYGEDFFMGDYVQVENEYDISGVAQITELVHSQNVSGITHYPAFVIIDDWTANNHNSTIQNGG